MAAAAATLHFDDEGFAKVLTTAILQSMTDEMKTDIIAQAITKLNGPSKEHYGYGDEKKTVLQAAFDNAISNMAWNVVTKIIEEDPMRMKQIKDGINKLLDDFPQVDQSPKLQAQLLEVIMKHIREGW